MLSVAYIATLAFAQLSFIGASRLALPRSRADSLTEVDELECTGLTDLKISLRRQNRRSQYLRDEEGHVISRCCCIEGDAQHNETPAECTLLYAYQAGFRKTRCAHEQLRHPRSFSGNWFKRENYVCPGHVQLPDSDLRVRLRHAKSESEDEQCKAQEKVHSRLNTSLKERQSAVDKRLKELNCPDFNLFSQAASPLEAQVADLIIADSPYTVSHFSDDSQSYRLGASFEGLNELVLQVKDCVDIHDSFFHSIQKVVGKLGGDALGVKTNFTELYPCITFNDAVGQEWIYRPPTMKASNVSGHTRVLTPFQCAGATCDVDTGKWVTFTSIIEPDSAGKPKKLLGQRLNQVGYAVQEITVQWNQQLTPNDGNRIPPPGGDASCIWTERSDAFQMGYLKGSVNFLPGY